MQLEDWSTHCCSLCRWHLHLLITWWCKIIHRPERYHLKFTIQTKPLPLSLWRAAMGCAADVPAPDIAPANLPLHSVGLSLLSCQKRSPWGCWKLGLALPCPVCYGLTHLLCMILVLLVQKYGLYRVQPAAGLSRKSKDWRDQSIFSPWHKTCKIVNTQHKEVCRAAARARFETIW